MSLDNITIKDNKHRRRSHEPGTLTKSVKVAVVTCQTKEGPLSLIGFRDDTDTSRLGQVGPRVPPPEERPTERGRPRTTPGSGETLLVTGKKVDETVELETTEEIPPFGRTPRPSTRPKSFFRVLHTTSDGRPVLSEGVRRPTPTPVPPPNGLTQNVPKEMKRYRSVSIS